MNKQDLCNEDNHVYNVLLNVNDDCPLIHNLQRAALALCMASDLCMQQCYAVEYILQISIT